MNRRDFLKILGLGAIASVIPLPKTSPEPPNLIPTLKEEGESFPTGSYGVNGYILTANGKPPYITYTSNAGDYTLMYASNPYITKHIPSLFERT